MLRMLLRVTLRSAFKRISSRHVDISSLYTKVPSLRQRIPNNVYQTWKKPVLAFRHARSVARFRKMNADYSFSFYDDGQMDEYMNRRFAGHPILKVYNEIQIPTSRVDVWRYCILFREGGIYCDIDSALTVPFCQILDGNPSELISFEGNKWRDLLDLRNYADPAIFLSSPPETITSNLEFPEHVILNWLLCFERESPILAEVIDLIVRHADFFRNREFDNTWKAVIHFAGPLALTQAVWIWMEKTKKRPHQCGIDFRDRGIFKLPGEEYRYTLSEHYTEITHCAIIGSSRH
jgi:hypothetical protein